MTLKTENNFKLNVGKTLIDVIGVHNGKCKLIVQDRNFMTIKDVKRFNLNYLLHNVIKPSKIL